VRFAWLPFGVSCSPVKNGLLFVKRMPMLLRRQSAKHALIAKREMTIHGESAVQGKMRWPSVQVEQGK
jgi:hypothetical protein